MADKFFDAMFTASVIGGSSGPAPVIVAKNITANGTYSAVDDQADGFNPVIVSVPNTYAASDEGKVVSGGQLVAQTSTTATANGTINTTTNNEVVVNVPNSYTASDEGKVVSGGSLVAQTAYPSEITTNNTYDTTNYNSVTVNVSATSSNMCCPVYYDSDYTQVMPTIIGIMNSEITVAGRENLTTTALTGYIKTSDLQLSGYISGNKTINALAYSSSSGSAYVYYKLKPADNTVEIKLSTGSSYVNYYGTATL